MRPPCLSSSLILCTNCIQPWPIVERFLQEQPDGAIGADVGCGNGKYLGVNNRCFIVGSDRYVYVLLFTSVLKHEVIVDLLKYTYVNVSQINKSSHHREATLPSFRSCGR